MKEAQLLEMELVYEQVNHLSQRIRTKAENGKEDSLHLAKKVSLQTLHSLLHTSQKGLVKHIPILAQFQHAAIFSTNSPVF